MAQTHMNKKNRGPIHDNSRSMSCCLLGSSDLRGHLSRSARHRTRSRAPERLLLVHVFQMSKSAPTNSVVDKEGWPSLPLANPSPDHDRQLGVGAPGLALNHNLSMLAVAFSCESRLRVQRPRGFPA